MKNKWQFLPGTLLLALGSLPLVGQVVIPNIFVSGETASAAQVNANFDALRAEVEALQAQVASLSSGMTTIQTGLTEVQNNSVLALDGLLEKVEDENGYATARFSGVNLQVVHGTGVDEQYVPNGLGNLIVGYNTPRVVGNPTCSHYFYANQTSCENVGEVWAQSFKTGSHNLVLGTGNAYGQTYGVVIGESSVVSASQAVAIGGTGNNAQAEYASVFGGFSNIANGSRATVVGGMMNTVSGLEAVISGGQYNEASGRYSSVSGGRQNIASGENSSVLGGYAQQAAVTDQTIPAL